MQFGIRAAGFGQHFDCRGDAAAELFLGKFRFGAETE